MKHKFSKIWFHSNKDWREMEGNVLRVILHLRVLNLMMKAASNSQAVANWYMTFSIIMRGYHQCKTLSTCIIWKYIWVLFSPKWKRNVHTEKFCTFQMMSVKVCDCQWYYDYFNLLISYDCVHCLERHPAKKIRNI